MSNVSIRDSLRKYISKDFEQYLCPCVIPAVNEYDDDGTKLNGSLKLSDRMVIQYFMAIPNPDHRDVPGRPPADPYDWWDAKRECTMIDNLDSRIDRFLCCPVCHDDIYKTIEKRAVGWDSKTEGQKLAYARIFLKHDPRYLHWCSQAK